MLNAIVRLISYGSRLYAAMKGKLTSNRLKLLTKVQFRKEK